MPAASVKPLFLLAALQPERMPERDREKGLQQESYSTQPPLVFWPCSQEVRSTTLCCGQGSAVGCLILTLEHSRGPLNRHTCTAFVLFDSLLSIAHAGVAAHHRPCMVLASCHALCSDRGS